MYFHNINNFIFCLQNSCISFFNNSYLLYISAEICIFLFKIFFIYFSILILATQNQICILYNFLIFNLIFTGCRECKEWRKLHIECQSGSQKCISLVLRPIGQEMAKSCHVTGKSNTLEESGSQKPKISFK